MDSAGATLIRLWSSKAPRHKRSPSVLNSLLDPLLLLFLYCATMAACRISPSSWFVRIGCLFLLAILIGGCTPSKTIRYPQDHERLQRLDQAVESLRDAYQKENRAGFKALLAPSDLMDELQRQVEMDFEAFQTIALEFTTERVMIQGEAIDVLVHWQGLWKHDAEDPGIKQRGHARLQWVGTQSILLRAAQGDLPFGMKAKQLLADPSSSPQTQPR